MRRSEPVRCLPPVVLVALLSLLSACGTAKHVQQSPAATASIVAREADAADAQSAAESLKPAEVGPLIRRVPVDAIDSTRTVQIESRERCGERITQVLPPPSTMGRMASWVGLGGPSEGELPAPEFRTDVQCVAGAVRTYAPARYRAEFRVDDETFLVNVGRRPGDTLQVDDTDHVIGPNPQR